MWGLELARARGLSFGLEPARLICHPMEDRVLASEFLTLDFSLTSMATLYFSRP
jgi:hypothetical protein